MSVMRRLFATKSLDELVAGTQEEGHQLKKVLGPWNLIALGVGAIIGAGIFATIGTAAAGDAHRPGAGPALMVSFILTAVVCGFTALCYAEFASMVPVSGSAYTYSYATLGELVAWIIGWDLMIEYAIGNVAVAISWANYMNTLLEGFVIVLPGWLTVDYGTAMSKMPQVVAAAPHIFGILIICTLIYAVIAAVFTGMIPYGDLVKKLSSEQAEPLTLAMKYATMPNWMVGVVAFGSVVAHTAVLLVFQLGQPRIFFAMSRDGLLPPFFARVHPRFGTPHVATIITGIFVGVAALFSSLDAMVDLTNIGTLFAFLLVCIGIIILRVKDPHRERSFRVPGGTWFLPVLGGLSCIFLAKYLPKESWYRFGIWLLVGMVVYLSYGYRHSRLKNRGGRLGPPGGMVTHDFNPEQQLP